MRLLDAIETGCNGFSAGAAEHVWQPSPSPAPLPLPHEERKGKGGDGSERMPETPHAMVAQVRYVSNERSGFLIRL